MRTSRSDASRSAEELRRVRLLAHWLDAKFSVAGFRFGFDTVIGLVPVVGDTITTVLGLYPLYVAHRHGLGSRLKFRMGLNLLADWVIGAIPVVGDILDVPLKANLKNLRLLEAALDRREALKFPGDVA